MHQMPLGMEVGVTRPHRRLCVRWGSSFPQERGTAAPVFRPMSIVATVAHLSYS